MTTETAQSKPPRRRPRKRRSVAASSWRVGALVIALIAAATGLTYRLAFYQIMHPGPMVSLADAERSGATSLPPSRGLIYDDAGNPLALDDQIYNVYATPRQVTRPIAEARQLAGVLKLKPSSVLRLISGKGSYVKVIGGISQSVANKVERKGLLGISLEAAPNRVYPEGSLASQVLGFVDANGGQYGLEERYNSLLSGSTSLSRFRDLAAVNGDVLRPDPQSAYQSADAGATLHLTLDTYIQDVAEQDLKNAVVKDGAAGGTVVIMNPWTGGILAMANYPTFNPNKYSASPVSDWSNWGISGTYEPGSTFKILTMATGLKDGVITPHTSIFDPGFHSYQPCITVQNWNYPVSNGQENMIQVLQHSANVGAAYVANLLGTNRFYKGVKAFGVGALTGVDLQGEVPGTLPLPGSKLWSCGNLYTNAYGQSLTMTPLQLLNDVDVVANGGWLMRPHVVSRVDYKGMTMDVKPNRVRRVLPWTTARTLTNMLVQSALGPPGEYGEASCALVPGYKVAAKTGTANLVNPVSGGYMTGPGSTIASTVGFAPAHDPRFSVLAVIRQPRTPWPDAQWGSETAAPLVHDLLQSSFLRDHIAPNGPSQPVLASQTAFGGCRF